MSTLKLWFRRRMVFKLEQRHRLWRNAFYDRQVQAEACGFRKRRELQHLVGRALWRYRMRMDRRRPLYGWIPFHYPRARPRG